MCARNRPGRDPPAIGSCATRWGRRGSSSSACVSGDAGALPRRGGESLDRLVLLAPFARGRTYLREMEMQRGSSTSRRTGRLCRSAGGAVGGRLQAEPQPDRGPRGRRSPHGRPPPRPRILWLGPDPSVSPLATAPRGRGRAVNCRPVRPGLSMPCTLGSTRRPARGSSPSWQRAPGRTRFAPRCRRGAGRP